MNFTEFFRKVISDLQREKIQFALAGGLVASVYRKTPRATKDIDILIFSESDPRKKAERIIKSHGLAPHALRKADLEGGPLFAIKKKSTPVYIVAGTGPNSTTGLDFLLPALPWAESAIERSRNNLIDFGFGSVPCLTVEDIVLAKLYAVNNQATRFMDLDDMKSLFESGHPLDLAYLSSQIQRLQLSFPDSIKPFVPKVLLAKK